MKIKDFTDEVFNVIEDLRRDNADKQYSDIIDDEGFQYVDIVMEGGGVLGIALVGFTYVLEQAGIRFMQIGGASAGAINAMMLAGLGTPAEAKSGKVLEELAKVDMHSFVDGDSDARDVINAWLKYGSSNFSSKKGKIHGLVDKIFSRTGKAYMYSQAVQVIDNIRDDLGLNPGEVFRQWVEGILKGNKISTTKDLLDKLNDLPVGLRNRNGKALDDIKPMLALVAADVSTQTKAIFPQMAELYWEKPDDVNPSDYVRASMSIPGFFQPFRVNNIPDTEKAMGCWRSYGYTETLPDSCVFIDGGIMSNFPINLFHRPEHAPTAPTFGVKLGTDKKLTEDISTPFTLLSVIFDTARFNLDNDFIARNPDYHKLVSYIDTGNHNWLNFGMTNEEKIDLFVRGAREAAKFLREFDWAEYKNIREGVAEAANNSNLPKDIMSGDAVPPIIDGRADSQKG